MKSLSIDPVQLPALPFWPASELDVRCIQITQETHDVASFCFAATQPMLFTFKPGQYVSLKVEINGRQEERCYSISTPPSRPYNFSITVKKVPGGLVSNWLHEHLHEGDCLKVQGPQGGFNIIDQPCDKALLLSGGSGITPLMSMTRWLYDTAAEVDLHFVHSARTPDDIIYHQELQAIDARAPNFRLSLVCEGSLSGATWSGYRGFLDAAMLQQMVPDLFERTVYVCGPETYMRAVRGILQSLDFPMQRYFEESFGGAIPVTPEPVPASDGESAKHQLNFSRAGKRVSGVAEETILDIAGKHGLWIPSACRMGFCGACKLRRVSGEVRMNHTGGISDTEINEGYILACCSYAEGDVEFDY